MRSSCVLVVSGLLAACGGGQPPVAEVQPVESATPATATADTPVSEPAKVALVFRVMREGGGGIDATINEIDPQGQVRFYATVPGTGEKALDKPCDAGQRFQAEPRVAAFLRGPTQECADRVEFMLYSTQATLQFIKRGDDASRGGDLLVAQSNYGTAADRLQFAEPDKARQLRVLSTVAAGRALGVTRPVQGAGGSEQPTPEFKDRVRVFQRQNGIEATGDLDARTRETLGRMQLRGDAVVVPPAASSFSPAGAAAVATAPALVVTPQAVTPAVEVRVSTAEILATPASPKTAAMIHANRAKVK
ncbi:MAG TPA: peptidoglycan-binding domain-containing protein [Steroidobacteraceae bacterium]|nr:peptidoglycan-binding domain-containing protein [Steroidobacteraceae bacterium]